MVLVSNTVKALMRDMVDRCSPSRSSRQSVVQETDDVVCCRVVARRREDPPLVPTARRSDAGGASSPEPVAHLGAITVPPCSSIENPPQSRTLHRRGIGRVPG